MNNYLLLIALSYIFLVVFVVWVGFYKGFDAKSKIIISLLLPLVYYLHWMGLQQSKGWPSDQTLPTQFELISADVVEPNQAKEVNGNIHLWIRPTGNGSPRAYILPYSRALHERLFEAQKRISQGRSQIGVLFGSDSRERGTNIGGGMKLSFRSAPRRRLPAKK
ncbi:MAG: hypothetical protein V3V19_10280 [Cocleimonas sp.]